MARRYDCTEATDRRTGLREATSAVRRGELVVLPTDTVYGIGADAFSTDAVGDLLEAKGRGRGMPSPVLVGSPNTLHGLVTDFSEMAWELVDAFWPGALTLVARHQPSLTWDLGRPTARSPYGCRCTRSPSSCSASSARWPSPRRT